MPDAVWEPAVPGPEAETPGGCQRLVVIRHGHPHIRWPASCSYREYGDWMDAYDLAGIHPKSEPPRDLREQVSGAGVFFTSEKARAVASAQRFAGDDKIRSLAGLNEVRLPVVPLPFVRMKAANWVLLSRLAHILGYSAGTETMGAALRRARAAVDAVLSDAGDFREAAIVGHGVINRLVGQALGERGWVRAASGGVEYWRWEAFAPRDIAGGGDAV